MKDRPDIFKYANYRVFLNDLYGYLKSTARIYSHRFIARELSLSSKGWFSDVLAGRINLISSHRVKLAKLFKLSGAEADYFEIIVKYDQATTEEERTHYLDKIVSHKNLSFSIVQKHQFELYRKWFVCVIRELLFGYDFADDYAALAAKLCPAITVKEAKEAITILESTGLIKKMDNGFYKPCDPIIKKDDTFRSIFWALYMDTTMRLAQEALHRYRKKEERDFSAVTVMLSKEGLEKAAACLKKTRETLLRISESDTSKNVVYQCNIQLFPVAR